MTVKTCIYIGKVLNNLPVEQLRGAVHDAGGDTGEYPFGQHIGCVVNDRPDRSRPGKFIGPQCFPDNPTGEEVAEKTQSKGNRDTCNKSGFFCVNGLYGCDAA